jgi:hypothetical protein
MPESDSGFYDNVLSSSRAELEPWQKNMLQIWYDNNHCAAHDADIARFRDLFKVEGNVVEAMLRRMHEADSMNISHFDTTAGQGSGSSWQTEAADMSNSMHFPDVQPELPSLAVGTESETQLALHSVPPASYRTFSTREDSRFHGSYGNDDGAYAMQSQFGPRPRETTPSLAPPYHAQFNDSSLSGHFAHALLTYPQGVQHDGTITYTGPQPDQRKALPRSLSKWIKSYIRSCNSKSCGPRHRRETAEGRYVCTLGCGRGFRSTKDLFRHEEIIYPQNFWFCVECGDLADPSKTHLFTRKDKMEQHMKRHHHSGGRQSIRKVTDVRPTFPKRCQICLHHTHATWSGRCNHIIEYYRREAVYQQALRSSRSIRGPDLDDEDEEENSVDDSDEDSDEDDEDDDNDHDASRKPGSGPSDPPPDDDNEQGGTGPSGHGSSHNHDTPYQEHNQNHRIGSDTATSRHGNAPFTGTYSWGSSTQPAYPSFISLTPLPRGEIRNLTLPVTWLGRINSKGGTASVYKVELHVDPVAGISTTTRPYAVKQYAASHQLSFGRELDAFTILHSGNHTHSHIIRCYGTFQYQDQAGNPTYNLLLEYADRDLADYWAVSRPTLANYELIRSWEMIFCLAEAVGHIHEARNPEAKVVHGVHMDLKPANILLVGGNWKVSDFGFTKFTTVEDNQAETKFRVDGGTLRYSE